jgi:hypothetical protein
MPGNMRLLGRVSKAIRLGAALAGAFAAVCVSGQTHKVAKPEQVVRAVGVYEWTGDIAKPTASRLIPVTVFIDGKLEDAGVYLARPVPFALLSGNLYELQQAGLPKGGLELSFAKHLQAIDTATGASEFDDGWFGYGNFKALPPPKKAPVLVASKNLSQIKSSKDDDGKPHFSNKTGSDTGAGSGTGTSGTGTTASGSGSGSGGGSGSGADSGSSAGSGSGTKSAGDPDRPTMKRRSGSGSDSSTGNSSGSSSAGNSSGTTDTSAPADDPDRPHLSKRSGSDPGAADSQSGDSSESTASASGSGSGSGTSSGQSGSAGSGGSGASGGTTTTASGGASGGSADDPDRPTLKRRTPEEMKKQGQKESSASVRGVGGSLNDDPDRPTLHYGKPTNSMTEADLPMMKGLPTDTQQMVAVSDAVNRDPHNFSRPWEDDAERAAVLTKMQKLARAKLAEYVAGAVGSAATTAAVSTTKAGATPAQRPTTAAAAAAARRKAAAAAPPPVELLDETLKGYTLSYGGTPTYVYTAHTAGNGATLDYVTVVAQADPTGELKAAISSATDAAHLDRTPRMRLVDAVDVEASNRASLLFELRGEKSRQFGVYRVIGARADETFATGTTE